MPLEIIIGDLLEKSVDAIVVPAARRNSGLSEFSQKLYTEAGYNELMAERKKLGHLSCGKSAVTLGFNLNAKYIIHTAIPLWENNMRGEAEKLSECYYSAMKCASGIGAGTVAFPLLGAGGSGFPANIVRRLAKNAIEDFLSSNHSPMIVYLVIRADMAIKLSEQYGECKLSDIERRAAYESKYLNELKASQLSAEVYNRKRVEYYLHKYITNVSRAANEIDWDRTLLSKFKSGATSTPERIRVISLAVYMKLTEEERLEFIHCSGYNKYPETEMELETEKLLNSGCTDFKELCDELYKINTDSDLTGRNKKNGEREK